MSSISFTFLLAVSFILFARVTSNAPYWQYNEYKFSCVSVCSQYLKGETYSCMSASGSGFAAGYLVVRILPNFDWRYYGIREMEHTKEFCDNVWLADQFYSRGNGTICNPIFPKQKGNMYYPEIRTRSEGGKTNEVDTKLDKLFGSLDKITQLVKEIQKQAMTTDETTSEDVDPSTSETAESSDARTKRLFPIVGSLVKNVLGVSNMFNTVNHNDIKNVHETVYVSAPINSVQGMENKVENKQYTERPYYRSYHHTPAPYYSDLRDSSAVTHDPRADAMCLWAAKSMCQSKQMVVCTYGVCCWAQLNTLSCDRIAYDNGIDIYRHSLYAIIQNARLY